MLSIYNMSRESLEKYFLEKNLAKFRATQVFEAIYRKKNQSFQEINNINKNLEDYI